MAHSSASVDTMPLCGSRPLRLCFCLAQSDAGEMRSGDLNPRQIAIGPTPKIGNPSPTRSSCPSYLPQHGTPYQTSSGRPTRCFALLWRPIKRPLVNRNARPDAQWNGGLDGESISFSAAAYHAEIQPTSPISLSNGLTPRGKSPAGLGRLRGRDCRPLSDRRRRGVPLWPISRRY
jgi:hypothetical protein